MCSQCKQGIHPCWSSSILPGQTALMKIRLRRISDKTKKCVTWSLNYPIYSYAQDREILMGLDGSFSSWTAESLHVTCRQLGFSGGRLHHWYPRSNDSSQLLYEDPHCTGNESSIVDCPNWNARQLGSGVCGERTLYYIFICIQILAGHSGHLSRKMPVKIKIMLITN